jgi:hypothetical protein
MLNSFSSVSSVTSVSKPMTQSQLPGKLLLYYPFTYDISNYVTGSATSDLTQTGTCNIVMNNSYYRICCDISPNSGYFLLPSTEVLNDPVLGYGISVSIYFNILSDSTPTVNTDRILSFNGIIDVFISQITGTSPTVSSFKITVNTPNNTFTSTTLNTNTVHHLVINQNFSNSSGSIYINKNLVYSADLQLTPTTLVSSYIGKNYTGSTLNTMHMQVFGFRLYNRALSSKEITTLYNEEYPSGTLSSTGLVLHYPMIDNNRNITPSAATDLIVTGTPTIIKNTTTKRFACDFVDGNSYCRLPNFTISTGFISISIWVNFLSDSVATNRRDRIICWDGGLLPARCFLRINLPTSGSPPFLKWSFEVNDNNDNCNLDTNKFHHIVLTCNTTNYFTGLYINNVTIHNMTARVSVMGLPARTYTVPMIGKSSFNGDPANKCHLQWFDHRIYNRLLSTTEITKLYTDVSNNLYLNKNNVINVA